MSRKWKRVKREGEIRRIQRVDECKEWKLNLKIKNKKEQATYDNTIASHLFSMTIAYTTALVEYFSSSSIFEHIIFIFRCTLPLRPFISVIMTEEQTEDTYRK